ncbi:hypothetical protein CC86DRAFT_422929 [Ophiobolus disseminans]|uniref:DNA2/NAM7 helicase-like C-terminal domain-containing protein n=1 Tax=Ophiobolus disseminans TaxID=1469910 RepID=A0A6A6ZP93_9PLEO|nr:hypothetical protein CC86DRAFT_422929 [Ophiobolus disseminans]
MDIYTADVELDSEALESLRDQPQEKEVRIKLDELDDGLRGLINKARPELYPTVISLGEGSRNPVSSNDIFGLRSQDSNSYMLPEDLRKGRKLRTIVVGGDGMCAGQHFHTSLAQAICRDQSELQLPPGTPQWNPEDLSPDLPASECVKVFFHLNTQTPNIELITQRVNKDTGDKTLCSCRLFAEDVDWDDEERVAFTVAKYRSDISVDCEKTLIIPEPVGKQLFMKYSQSFEKTCVIRVSIRLAKISERSWFGISVPDLAAIRARPDPGNSCDNLIICLDKNDKIDLFFSCKSDTGCVDQWEKRLATYMQDLLTVAKRHKNFWFLRWQYEHAGQDARGDVLFNTELPNVDWEVPRWLVKEWIFTKKTSSDGVVTLSKPRPADWSPLDFPISGYNIRHEATFASKISDMMRCPPALADSVDAIQNAENRIHDNAVEIFPDLISDLADKGMEIRPDHNASTADKPLRNMLRHYWKQRLGEDYRGWGVEVGLDVTGTRFGHEISPGTTTRHNRKEAEVIALTVIDMIMLEAPNDFEHGFRQIRGKDILVIANYSGQITEIRRAVTAHAEGLNIAQDDLDDIWYRTTANLKGIERNITFYNTTIASGTLRLLKDENLPLGFVANVHNLNMFITRCQIARYIVGAHQLFLRAKQDHHPISKYRRYLGFFDLISSMHYKGCIVALADTERWNKSHQQPEPSNTLAKQLAETVTLKKDPDSLKQTYSPGRGSRQGIVLEVV